MEDFGTMPEDNVGDDMDNVGSVLEVKDNQEQVALAQSEDVDLRSLYSWKKKPIAPAVSQAQFMNNLLAGIPKKPSTQFGQFSQSSQSQISQSSQNTQSVSNQPVSKLVHLQSKVSQAGSVSLEEK